MQLSRNIPAVWSGSNVCPVCHGSHTMLLLSNVCCLGQIHAKDGSYMVLLVKCVVSMAIILCCQSNVYAQYCSHTVLSE